MSGATQGESRDWVSQHSENPASYTSRKESRPGVERTGATANRPGGVVGPTPAEVTELVQELDAAAKAVRAGVDSMSEWLGRATHDRSRGDMKAGRCEVAQVAATLRTLAVATGMLVSAPGVADANRVDGEQFLARFRGTLVTLDSRRRRSDWTGVTRLVDEELKPLLSQWSAVLRAVGGDCVDQVARTLRPQTASRATGTGAKEIQ